MPGSGAIDKNDKWHIELELNGPLSKAKSDALTDRLNKFLKKNKLKMLKKKSKTVPKSK
jgi:hypothetical protein